MIYYILTISTVLNAVVSLIVGLGLYISGKRNPTHRAFAFTAMCYFFWSIFYFFPFFPESKSLSLLSFQLLHIASNFLPIFSLQLSLNLVGLRKKYKKTIYYLFGFFTLFLFVIPSEYFIKGVVPKFNIPFWAEINWIYPLWLLIWSSLFFVSAYVLYWGHKKFEGLKKYQLKYLFISLLISIIAGSMNYFLFFNINIPPVLNFVSSFYLIITAYLIARYNFLDITVNIFLLLEKGLSLIISIVFGIIGYLFLESFQNLSTQFSISITILFAYASFYLLLRFFHSHVFHNLTRLDKFAYFEKKINQFINRSIFYKNISSLNEYVQKCFVKELKIESANIKIISQSLLKKEFKGLYKHFQNKKDDFLVFSQEEFKKHEKNKPIYYLNELKKLGEFCVPLWGSEEKIIGFFVLGEKEFKNPYRNTEINLILKATNHISLALAILNYNQNLKEEVEQKTKQLHKQKKQLEKSNKELKKLDELKDSFLSVASHELRTPMTVIKGYSEFLLSEKFGKLNEKQKKFQDKIFNNTQQLLELVNDILDLSKLNAERMVFNFLEFDLQEFMEDALSNFKILCEKKEIKLKLETDKKISVLTSDKEKIQRILNNLVGNAYKFTPEKGKITVKVSPYKTKKNFILFEVIDTGIGIAPEDQEKVFEKFQQVANYLQTPYNGTGLGLPIVKKIIEKLGGEIWVESEPEKGSNFSFIIPLTPPKNVNQG